MTKIINCPLCKIPSSKEFDNFYTCKQALPIHFTYSEGFFDLDYLNFRFCFRGLNLWILELNNISRGWINKTPFVVNQTFIDNIIEYQQLTQLQNFLLLS